MTYQKELKKILVLLVVGLISAIAMYFYANATYSGRNDLDGGSLLILVAITFYPIGIVYGWRDIFNLYNRMRARDREHWARTSTPGYTTLMISCLSIGLAIGITFSIGWVFGVLKAYKSLKQKKLEA